eukprot:NODE_64_length_24072_cov_0.332541.p9 type:complete len:126 gc:universal NODE_64_length_24072_cov_0.332541:23529-23152(-)
MCSLSSDNNSFDSLSSLMISRPPINSEWSHTCGKVGHCAYSFMCNLTYSFDNMLKYENRTFILINISNSSRVNLHLGCAGVPLINIMIGAEFTSSFSTASLYGSSLFVGIESSDRSSWSNILVIR